MKKIYILDTSALIEDPCAWEKFPDSEVIIPIAVLNELDKLKKQPNEVGKNARVCIRMLDEISDKLDITTGIQLENNILLKIDTTYLNLSESSFTGLGDPDYGDTQILAAAIEHYKNNNFSATLVSNDINLRIKAKSRGLDAKQHNEKSNATDLYSGTFTCENTQAAMQLLEHGWIDPVSFKLNELLINQSISFQDEEENVIALGRKVSSNKIKILKKSYPWGLSPRNIEQTFAIDLLMDRNIDLVSVVGPAGCGKSLVALAAALELVLNKREFERLIIYRPISTVGEGVGFLPGELNQKLDPYFSAIYDSLEVLFSAKGKKNWKEDLEMYINKGRLSLETIAFARGRSIPNSIILLDEAQNMSKEEIKTIITRVGDNTKFICTGDITQLDSPKLDAINNGLTHVVDCFKGHSCAGHILLTKGERSKLATLASELL